MIKYLFQLHYQNGSLLYTTAFFVEDIHDSLLNIETIVLKLTSKTGTDVSEIKNEIEELKKTIKRPVFDHIDKFIKEKAKQMEEMKKTQGKGDFYVQ